MAEQVITIVKVPIKEIENWIRTKHDLPSALSDFHIEENNLILSFHEGFMGFIYNLANIEYNITPSLSVRVLSGKNYDKMKLSFS